MRYVRNLKPQLIKPRLWPTMRGNRIDTHIQTHLYYVHTHTNIATYIYFFLWQLNASITISSFDLLSYKRKKRFIKRFLPLLFPLPLLAQAVGKQFSHSWKFVCHRHTMKNRRAHEVKFIFSIKSNRRLCMKPNHQGAQMSTLG